MTERLRKHYQVEYNALINAIHRCSNRKHAQYKDYGGRGIKVHESFLGPEGFWRFLDEVGPKPSPELTLDRKSNDKGYEPGNLIWASRKQQTDNRRAQGARVSDLGWGSKSHTFERKDGKLQTITSPIVKVGDELLSIKEWSAKLGVNQRTLRQRLYRGLTPAQAMVPGLFNTWGKPRNDKPTIH